MQILVELSDTLFNQLQNGQIKNVSKDAKAILNAVKDGEVLEDGAFVCPYDYCRYEG